MLLFFSMHIQIIFYYRTSFGGYVLMHDVLRVCRTSNRLRNELITMDMFIDLSLTVPLNFEEPSS